MRPIDINSERGVALVTEANELLATSEAKLIALDNGRLALAEIVQPPPSKKATRKKRARKAEAAAPADDAPADA
ncbi:MAG: hypothetical protein V3S01_10845 [Dehalococcoidia bacterium]